MNKTFLKLLLALPAGSGVGAGGADGGAGVGLAVSRPDVAFSQAVGTAAAAAVFM